MPAKKEKNKKRIRREYEENTKRIRAHLASTWLATGLCLALRRLWGGLLVPLGSFASPFYILHSAFCLRLRVAFGETSCIVVG